MPITRIGTILILALVLTTSIAAAEVVTLGASRDNTLFEDVAGSLSNGSGPHLFIGRVAPGGGGLARRAVLAFDVAADVPRGAKITSVSLTLNMSRTIASARPATLHRLTTDWGEGASNSGSPGGTGAPSAEGDATWIHRFYDTETWSTAGGDFDPAASATTMVGGTGTYVWSGPGMVADVQNWVNQPATNRGWILLGNESTTTTAKRFDSRENANQSVRPLLEIDFTPPTPPAVPAASDCGVALLILAFTAAVIYAGRRHQPAGAPA